MSICQNPVDDITDTTSIFYTVYGRELPCLELLSMAVDLIVLLLRCTWTLHTVNSKLSQKWSKNWWKSCQLATSVSWTRTGIEFSTFVAEYDLPAGACNHFTDLFSCLIVKLPVLSPDWFWFRFREEAWWLTVTCPSMRAVKVAHFHSWLTSTLTREMTSSLCSHSRFWGAESSNLFMLICTVVTSVGIFETVTASLQWAVCLCVPFN